MSELLLPKVAKSDIDVLPSLELGHAAVVIQRHENYVTDRSADNAGSLYPENAKAAFERHTELFAQVFDPNIQDELTMVLFTASDTRYANKGYRAMETAWIVQNAAIAALNGLGLQRDEHIINFNPAFATPKFLPAGAAEPIDIRPDLGLREPQLFDEPNKYLDYLFSEYGSAPDDPNRLSTQGWAKHEQDADREVREAFGAEGVYDILARTKQSLSDMQAYAQRFHQTYPYANLRVWMNSHYDTISPLVKDTAGMSFDQYLPVEHAGGVIIDLTTKNTPTMFVQGHQLGLQLGSAAPANQSAFPKEL